MITEIILVVAMATWGTPTMPMTSPKATATVLHTYEARIRLDGKVSTIQVKAIDAGQATISQQHEAVGVCEWVE